MAHDYRRNGQDAAGGRTTAGAPANLPGKRTLVEGGIEGGGTATPAPVQRKAAGPSTEGDVHDAAQRGIADGGSRLPHLDLIQQSFGAHDVSNVQAHTGEAATRASGEIGAQAYATGNHVAFAGNPDLHTAAHEAAHVVQQRSGVHLSGGVGQAGDPYERHADAVADAVVAGRSAEGLLSQMAPSSAPSSSGGAGASIQRLAGETMSGNPQDLKDSAGNTTTEHHAPTVGDAANHAAPGAAGSEARPANIKVIATESKKLHLEPPASPAPDLIYQEGPQVDPPPPGFTMVQRTNGTLAAPKIDEDADNGLYIGGQPSADDVHQMGIGDCYFLSTLMGVAARDPGKIKSMMSPDGHGGAAVQLWRKQPHTKSLWEKIAGGPDADYIPVSVSVSGDLAFNKAGQPGAGRIHGAQLRAAPNPKSVDWWAKVNGDALEVHRKDLYEVARWAPLLEKAFARFSEQHGQYGGFQGGATTPAGGSGYKTIDNGVAAYALYPIYGAEADTKGADNRISGITWTPGGNTMATNRAAVDQLLLLANRGETAAPGDTNAPIMMAQTNEQVMVNRLGLALPVAIADPDFAKLDAERQQAVRNVQTAWTNWNALPPDPPAPAAQPKATAYTAIGNACTAAVKPGPVNSAGLDTINKVNPKTVPFDSDKDVVPPASIAALTGLGVVMIANQTPATKVSIVGHASSDGAEKHNQDLSERRAKNVSAALTAVGSLAPHTLDVTGAGASGADATAVWRRADISIAPVEAANHLHEAIRSQAIRAAMDLMLDLCNMGTDHSPGQRNIYGGHVYAVLGASFVNTTGGHVPLESVSPAQRPMFYPLVDTNASTVRLRNPHHNNEPDRQGNNTPTRPGDGVPTTGAAGESDGTFTMSVEEFFRNFNTVQSGVLPRH